jgi:hypothetical protein
MSVTVVVTFDLVRLVFLPPVALRLLTREGAVLVVFLA